MRQKRRTCGVVAVGLCVMLLGIAGGSWTRWGVSVVPRAAMAQESDVYCDQYGYTEGDCTITGYNCSDGTGAYHENCQGGYSYNLKWF